MAVPVEITLVRPGHHLRVALVLTAVAQQPVPMVVVALVGLQPVVPVDLLTLTQPVRLVVVADPVTTVVVVVARHLAPITPLVVVVVVAQATQPVDFRVLLIVLVAA